MSIINSLRNSIANLIAADRQPVQMIVDNSKALTHSVAPAHVLTQHERAEQASLAKGKFYVMDLTRLNSQRVRDAITSLGCWSALARSFSEYERVTGKREMNDAKLSMLFDEFHAWNSATADAGIGDGSKVQMGEDAIFEAVAKMSVVTPSRGSAETDAILARVKKMSVADIRADRIAKAEKKTAARIDLIEGFVGSVMAYQGSEVDHHGMSSAKALDKAIQTLEWVASWDSQNPAEQAAELLLIEDDIKLIRELSKVEVTNSEEYVEGVMASDTLERNINNLDKHRRAGESAKGAKGYEPEPMEKVMEELEAERRPARRRIPATK